MKGLLVFNAQNDLVYWRWNPLFVKHTLTLASAQGLLTTGKPLEGEDAQQCGELSPDVVIQIFFPIITSQRIMGCQFGNSYTSIQTRDGTNVVFDEYMGYLLVQIGCDSVSWLQRALATAVWFIKYFCGPDVSLIKNEKQRSGLSLCLTSWERLVSRDQAARLGCTEGPGESGAVAGAAAGLAALKSAVATLPAAARPAHAAIFVGSKLLSLYSSRGAEDLPPGDTVFLSILASGAQDTWSHRPPTSGDSSPEPALEEETFECESVCQSLSWTVLLSSTPHGLHVLRLSSCMTLCLATALPGGASGAAAAQALQALHGLHGPLAMRDKTGISTHMPELERCMKKASDILKKHKLLPGWDSLRRHASAPDWLPLEAGVGALSVGLRTALQLAAGGFSSPQLDVRPAAQAAAARMATAGATNNKSPAMSRFVEEFPGLVHFLHIDRTNHRLTAPALNHCSHMLSKKKIWQMLERAGEHVSEGHLTSMWRDGALHYAHIVWFEDPSGAPLKPARPQHQQDLPRANLTPHQYYSKLTELCFPGSAGRVRCWELLAVHLGLLPCGTALAHIRRLAATVSDLHAPPHPVQLL